MYMMFMFTIFMLLISFIMIFMNFLISKKIINDREKNSSFECGFDPFSSARLPFSIQFYMISIIFLIFDIEIIIILPLIPAMIYSSIEISSMLLFYFILILILGLLIEWNDGALKWLK